MPSGNLRDAFPAFTTTCALITTDGPHGPNVMAAEWTFNVSYRPFLILVAIDPGNRTHDMILESQEFGVNLVAEDQVAAMGFAGHYSKADTDKLSSEAFDTFPAKHIRAPLIRGALLAAECRLVAHYPMGDHTAFVGEVVEFSVGSEKSPVVLHHGSRRLGERIVRAPGLLVAVTPMSAQPGEAVATANASTDEEGSFRARLRVPPDLRSGRYLLEAAGEGARGQAHLEVRA
ncbi:MAG TPA: flavin reductase family protein [Thermoplasmata archaeon]|nr:flavin reductase family protein [Thermoplasmata archaeon]